jgi:hypothetical protein
MEGEISANHSAYWPHARDSKPPKRLEYFENGQEWVTFPYTTFRSPSIYQKHDRPTKNSL